MNMTKKQNYLIFSLILCASSIVLIILILSANRKNSESGKVALGIKGRVLSADIALTDTAREKGLSGRDKIGENEAMLFIFQSDEIRNFWMKDMKFAIDIIWVDSSRRIIGVTSNARPESWPDLFPSPAPVRYVIEVPAGWTAKQGDLAGQIVHWQ